MSRRRMWAVLLVGTVVIAAIGIVFTMVATVIAHGGSWWLGTAGWMLTWTGLASAGVVLLAAVQSEGEARARAKMLDRQTGIESIRALSWKQFEQLLGEVYRRKGHGVQGDSHRGADGGIDLILSRSGETWLVQAKHWKVYRVGVKVVREMLGLVTAHHATGAIVISSGEFTREARAFASQHGIKLVNGDALLAMIRQVQPEATRMTVPTEQAKQFCPRCGGDLVVRTARQGPNAGGKFWGCSSYPKCRFVKTLGGS